MARPDTPRAPLRKLEKHRFSANQQIPLSINLDPHLRYVILDRLLGCGRYSKVSPAIDQCTGSVVAVKSMPRSGIFKVDEHYFRREVRMLNKLLRLPPSSVARFCELRDHFITSDAFCMVFDAFGDNLYTILYIHRFSSFPVYQVKEISRQLIQATRYLHDNGIIHTDLRPENVVFTSKESITQSFYGLDNAFHTRTILKSTELRIIDFGSVYEHPTNCSGVIGLAGYRPPEVVMSDLGWSWSETVDHFALGCIIAEVMTNQPLLQTFSASTEEDIAVLDKIVGPFPDYMVDTIKTELPSAFEHRGCENYRFSYSTDKFLRTAKTVKERIEDRDAAKLISRLTHPDPSKRGELKTHERSKFVTTYEM